MEKGEKVALLAIGVNLILFGIKSIFAEISGRFALRADAFHSLSDVVASSTVFAGLLVARRKTRSFPYGLYKVDIIATVMPVSCLSRSIRSISLSWCAMSSDAVGSSSRIIRDC